MTLWYLATANMYRILITTLHRIAFMLILLTTLNVVEKLGAPLSSMLRVCTYYVQASFVYIKISMQIFLLYSKIPSTVAGRLFRVTFK